MVLDVLMSVGEPPEALLLVEGSDDEHIFYSLLKQYNVPDCFKIKNKAGIDKLKKGFDNLLDTLDVEIDRSGLKRLGVVVDADNDPNARWQALRNILLKSGYDSVPLNLASDGIIIEQQGKPIIGFWIMPDNRTVGAIEDFIGSLVPSNDPFWSMAGDVLQKVIEVVESNPRFQTVDKNDHQFHKSYGSHIGKVRLAAWKSKARLHTWLAWQNEPGARMGIAITKRYLDTHDPHAQQLIAWIRKLFVVESS